MEIVYHPVSFSVRIPDNYSGFSNSTALEFPGSRLSTHEVKLSFYEVKLSFYEGKTSVSEIIDIRRNYLCRNRNDAVKELCNRFGIDYSHIQTVEVREDSYCKGKASIFLAIKPEYEQQYALRESGNLLGVGVKNVSACQSQPVKNDVLMKRKKRSITLG